VSPGMRFRKKQISGSILQKQDTDVAKRVSWKGPQFG
jgi:hypothetical protein